VTEGLELGGRMLEIGPEPGAATGPLSRPAERLTAIELDPELAGNPVARFAGANVCIVRGDATRLPLADGALDATSSLTMLHHVPGVELQDRLLAEVARVLPRGGLFVGIRVGRRGHALVRRIRILSDHGTAG
jgi:SAM-dependent methyltransferase